MLFRRRLRRPSKGDPITAAWMGQLVDEIERLMVVAGGGINVEHTVAGQVVSATQPEVGDFLQVGSGGITAFNTTTKVLGFGTCRLWLAGVPTDPLIDSGIDITVYSDMPAVAAGRWGQLKYIRGLPAIDVASC